MANSAPGEKLFRDPVHDLIAFDLSIPGDALLARLLDTAEMQRLRRIRQLGMARLAFPGAEHSRFGHALGTVHLARRMLSELAKHAALDPEMVLACQCAALLHDVGHGPYSHILEHFLGVSHEERAVEIILSAEGEVHRLLAEFDPALPERAASIIRGDSAAGIYSSIISSQLDADRMDYLLRDSLMTGVKYGVYDLERLLKMLRLDPLGGRVVLVHQGLMPVEKYLQSRHHMYRQVYFHKAVTAAEVMIASLVRRAAALALPGKLEGAEDGDSPLHRFLLRPRSLSLAEFLEFDDVEMFSLIKRWTRAEDPILSMLSERLLNRRLFKSINVSHIEDPLDSRLAAGRRAIEEAGLDPAHYFLRIESSDTPYSPYDPARAGGGAIYIEDAGGALRDVEALSPTISAFSRSAYTLTRIVFPESANGVDLRARMKAIFL